MGLAFAAPAQADVLGCGSVLTTPNTTVVLEADVDCTASSFSYGIFIQADNVTLDLNGHTILGNGPQPSDQTSNQGVFISGDAAASDNDTVKNGTITGFSSGVYAEFVSGLNLTGLNVHDNVGPDFSGLFGEGIQLFLDSGSTITKNQMTNNGPFGGIRARPSQPSSNNIISQNQVTNNAGDGIAIKGNSNTVEANNVRNNGANGISVNGSTNTVRFNKAYGNPSAPNPGTFDLKDATTSPPCGSDVWKANGFGTKSQACIGNSRATAADFNGDGITDVSVFRGGAWYINDAPSPTYFGLPGDIPVAGDYNGDGVTDIAVFRPSSGAWYVNGGGLPTLLGMPGDIPVPGDYNGDGITDMAVFRPSTGAWYIGANPPVFFGLSGDIPVAGDYDRDGVTDIAVFRPSTGAWYVDTAIPTTTFFGLPGDTPAPGDYDGDGGTDIAVFRPFVSGAAWYVDTAVPTTTFFGQNGDIAAPGDYDGNVATDIAVFRPSVGGWYINTPTPITTFYGLSGDIPIPKAPHP